MAPTAGRMRPAAPSGSPPSRSRHPPESAADKLPAPRRPRLGHLGSRGRPSAYHGGHGPAHSDWPPGSRGLQGGACGGLTPPGRPEPGLRTEAGPPGVLGAPEQRRPVSTVAARLGPPSACSAELQARRRALLPWGQVEEPGQTQGSSVAPERPLPRRPALRGAHWQAGGCARSHWGVDVGGAQKVSKDNPLAFCAARASKRLE